MRDHNYTNYFHNMVNELRKISQALENLNRTIQSQGFIPEEQQEKEKKE